MSMFSFVCLGILFYFACVTGTGSDKKVTQLRLENLHNPIYELIFDFLDYDLDSMTPAVVNLQLLNKETNQKIQHAVQLYYQNLKTDIQLFCTKNTISIPPDFASCKRKRTKNRQALNDKSNFVKHFIHHFSTVLKNAFQQRNDYPDTFKFYHELFKRKHELPVRIQRLLIFGLANSFPHTQRHQIFDDNELIRFSNQGCPWMQDDFIYNFRTSGLAVMKYTFKLRPFYNYTDNIQLPLFFICSSSTQSVQPEQIFCLQNVQVLVKLDKDVSLKFHKPGADYYIVYRPGQTFIGYSGNKDFTIEPCFNLKNFI